MQKLICKALVLFVLVCSTLLANAQTTVGTTTTFTNNNGTGGCSFNIENANAYDIIITDVEGMPGTSGSCTAEFWLYNGPLTGAPSALNTTNGWTQVATSSFTGVASTLQPILTATNIVIPANSTRGVVIFCTSQRYFTMPSSPYDFTAGGVTLKFSSTFSYGNGTPPAAPSIASRGWIGNITFKPACINPANLQVNNITSNSANFTWNSVPNSQGYEFDVTTSSTPPAAGNPVSVTNASGIGLLSNTTYYVHVRNKCTGGSFSNWTTQSFTTLINPCASPTGLVVNAPTATSATFTWTQMPGTLGYEYVVNQIAAPPTGSGTPTMVNGGSASGLTGGGSYYVHVRQKCSSTGGTWSDWSSTPFTMPECKAPENILFSNITGTSADAIWSVMAAANFYQYQIDNTPADPVGGGSGYTTTTSMMANFTSLLPETKYYLHIRSMCFVSDSSHWALDSFITQSFCGAPNLQVNNANTSNPDATWAPVPTAVAYEYAVRPTMATPAFGAELQTTSVAVSLPQDGKDYYLHVRSKCNSMYAFSTWSTAVLREQATGIDNLNDGLELEVYPNPVKDKLTIKAYNIRDGISQITITDLSGKIILTDRMIGKQKDLDISSLPSGLYLLHLKNDNTTNTVKLSHL